MLWDPALHARRAGHRGRPFFDLVARIGGLRDHDAGDDDVLVTTAALQWVPGGEPADYLRLLLDGGLAADVWETTYEQVLEFEEGYGRLLRAAYPRGEHGTVFGFRRIFAVGHRE